MKTARTLAIVWAAAAAACLGGCATAPLTPVPGTVEEQLWFDRAVGPEIYDVPPEARFHGLRGYPRTDYRVPPGYGPR